MDSLSMMGGTSNGRSATTDTINEWGKFDRFQHSMTCVARTVSRKVSSNKALMPTKTLHQPSEVKTKSKRWKEKLPSPHAEELTFTVI